MELFIPSNLTIERVQAVLSALPKSRNKDFMQSANLIIEKNAYSLPPFGTVKFVKLIDWNDNRSRSFERLIHGHTYIGCLTDAYEATNNVQYLNKGMDLIIDWLEKHSYETHKGTMAYHDETTALRLQYFLRFYIYAKNIILNSQIEVLEKRMWETAALLAEDEFHSTNTNHGMFQDIALLLFSVYFEGEDDYCNKYKYLAVMRLKEYFTSVYTSDGVHKEHSPSYHMLVASNIKKLVVWMEDIDIEISREFKNLFIQSEKFSTFIIRPDGYFPPTCDTESTAIIKSSYSKLYESETYRYAVTAGKAGIAPNETDVVFPEAGYAIFRDDWSKKDDASYVLFTAAYNANYHKHSDDLNLTIYSGGEIITEAGPNGYNYQDPFTKYAYSSYAHNTLIVDGKGLPRTDGKYDKVYMSDYYISEQESQATGVNLRYDGVSHKRTVNYKKNDQVIRVKDIVTSEMRHEYKLLWHVAPNIKVHVRDRFVELFRENKKVMEIEFSTSSPIRVNSHTGEVNPTILGWYFPKMEDKKPLTTIEVELSGSNVSCITHFRLGAFTLGDGNRLPFELEKVYETTRSLRYHFEPASDEKYKEKLFVIFSAMSPINKFVYNYMRSMDEIKANKLFILDDFGDQGSYYIGQKRDYSIETAVSSLIQYIMSKLNILHKDVTTIGSSKGGYAALLFGIKYHFGNVIAGAPQSKVGHFLINQANHPNIASYISGGSEETDCYYLDRILFGMLNQPNDFSPKINILIGTKDHHYSNHVIPLYDVLKERGYKVELEVKDGINHEDLRTHFPPYLIHKSKLILGLESEYKNDSTRLKINRVELKKTGNMMLEVSCDVQGQGLEYAYYIYKDNEIVEKLSYKKNSKLNYNVKEKGRYFVRVYVKDLSDQRTALNTNAVSL